MMRGHALRLKAILLRKKSPQDALDLLDKSLEILKDANMPIEYGFTERRRSELLNTLGREAEAEAAEETSLMLLSRIGLGRKRSPWTSPELLRFPLSAVSGFDFRQVTFSQKENGICRNALCVRVPCA